MKHFIEWPAQETVVMRILDEEEGSIVGFSLAGSVALD